MKNTIKLFGIIAFVATIGFSMVACGESKIPNGTYVSTDCSGSEASFTFSEKKVIAEGTFNCTTVDDGEYTYIIRDGFLILHDEKGKTKDVKYDLEGKKLTVYNIDNQETINDGTVFTKITGEKIARNKEFTEEPATSDWSSVYKQLLNDRQRLLQDFETEYGNIIEIGQFRGCLIYDIDANGIPEFFVTYTSYAQYESGENETVIYGIVNEKLVKAGHFNDVRFFAEKKVPGIILGIWGEVYPQYQYNYKNGVFSSLPDNYVSYPEGIESETIKVGANIYAFNQEIGDNEQNLFGNGKEFVYITGYEHKNFQSAFEAYTNNR